MFYFVVHCAHFSCISYLLDFTFEYKFNKMEYINTYSWPSSVSQVGSDSESISCLG